MWRRLPSPNTTPGSAKAFRRHRCWRRKKLVSRFLNSIPPNSILYSRPIINRQRADKAAGGLVPVQAQPLDNPFGTRLSPMSWGMFGGILTIIGKAASVGVAKAIAAC